MRFLSNTKAKARRENPIRLFSGGVGSTFVMAPRPSSSTSCYTKQQVGVYRSRWKSFNATLCPSAVVSMEGEPSSLSAGVIKIKNDARGPARPDKSLRRKFSLLRRNFTLASTFCRVKYWIPPHPADLSSSPSKTFFPGVVLGVSEKFAWSPPQFFILNFESVKLCKPEEGKRNCRRTRSESAGWDRLADKSLCHFPVCCLNPYAFPGLFEFLLTSRRKGWGGEPKRRNISRFMLLSSFMKGKDVENRAKRQRRESSRGIFTFFSVLPFHSLRLSNPSDYMLILHGCWIFCHQA